jgi:hypothetical protein
MSVPLDRLYHYLADCVNHDLIIYRWAPHGSRKLEDLSMLRGPYQDTQPMMICHDQEPLDLARYSKQDFKTAIRHYFQNHDFFKNLTKLTADPVISYLADLGFRGLTIPTNQFDHTLLLHSEQNSTAVTALAQQGYMPVYYWSHGMIAQDWFRYARHDPVLTFAPENIQKDFLIYNRAWSGTREYRLCFAEQLVNQQLVQHCNMSFSATDAGHYSQHQFVNPKFQISNFNLHDFFPINAHPADASADYCGSDYATAGIEIVLETLFDDSRWHLTEKTLRPIACGKPFLLMSTQGSLEYLRQYGFETFEGLIDQRYDQIVEPRLRLQAVLDEMTRISQLEPTAKIKLFAELHEIARRNQHRFFNEFFDQVSKEYVNNITQAMSVMQQHCTGHHCDVIQTMIR